MKNASSDFKLGENSSVHVLFVCDGQSVTFQFFAGDEKAGQIHHLSRADAVKVGEQVAETGIYEDFPIEGIPLDSVRAFGKRLRQYGEQGE